MEIVPGLHAFEWLSETVNNCNSYLIDGPTRVLIDPGHRSHVGQVESGLRQLGLAAEDIGLLLCTHAHPDHIEAVTLFKGPETLFALHEAEWDLVKAMAPHLGPALGAHLEDLTPDLLLKEGSLALNGLDLEILHTPGHSPGSVSVFWPACKALFTGDVIFAEGVGRTDLPGGDGELLKQSIQRLAQLEIDILLPGHGPAIQGAREVQANFSQAENFWFSYL